MRDMMKYILPAAALLGFLSVALAAAGRHILAPFPDAQGQDIFGTALRYHQLYSVLICALGFQARRGLTAAACAAFLSGTVVFCGSLYLLAFTHAAVFSAMTPVGGGLLMAGWGLLFLAALPRRDGDHP